MARDDDWWRGAVIYQIYPRSFFDSDGDGVGDLPGVTAKLDYVADLGVDAIWLCPYFTSPQKDFGYDVANHVAVDPLFGTLADFDGLLDRAHRLGLRVLIDQVWSHTSDRHPWFLESRANRDDLFADWYVWADPSPDGTPPKNWLSVFGGPAWTWEPRRRQYYLHHFLHHQPSLNLRNPAVMESLLAGGEFWLQRGVDGFRLDAIDFLLHDPALRSNPPAPASDIPCKLFGMQAHHHDMLHADSTAVLSGIRALMERYPDSVTLGEVSSQPGAFERVVDCTNGNKRLHMAYTLRPMRGRFDWLAVRGMLRDLADAGEAGWVCWSFSNHDVERAISRWNPRRDQGLPPHPAFARLLMALLLSLRGSVCLYQGEELGLTEAELTLHQLRDPFGIAYWPEFRGRDGSRTPIPWQGGAPHAGFTTGIKAPWLPVPSVHHDLAVDRHEADAYSLLHAFRRFLAWRRCQPALVRGTIEPLDLPPPLVGFIRRHEGQSILAVFNLSNAAMSLDATPWPGMRVQTESGICRPATGDRLPLGPYGVLFAALAPTRAMAGAGG